MACLLVHVPFALRCVASLRPVFLAFSFWLFLHAVFLRFGFVTKRPCAKMCARALRSSGQKEARIDPREFPCSYFLSWCIYSCRRSVSRRREHPGLPLSLFACTLLRLPPFSFSLGPLRSFDPRSRRPLTSNSQARTRCRSQMFACVCTSLG